MKKVLLLTTCLLAVVVLNAQNKVLNITADGTTLSINVADLRAGVYVIISNNTTEKVLVK